MLTPEVRFVPAGVTSRWQVTPVSFVMEHPLSVRNRGGMACGIPTEVGIKPSRNADEIDFYPHCSLHPSILEVR